MVHAVNHALGHSLSRSVTVAVVHALNRAQTHYYYCLYCYYHGSYCQARSIAQFDARGLPQPTAPLAAACTPSPAPRRNPASRQQPIPNPLGPTCLVSPTNPLAECRQFCEFYNEYAQLGSQAKGWGQYKPRTGEGATEHARLSAETRAKWSGMHPYEPHWSTEAACYSHFRPRGCALPAPPQTKSAALEPLPTADEVIKRPCTPKEVQDDYQQSALFENAGGFRDCRLSDLVAFFHEHTTFCVLPPDKLTPGLENGLRMRAPLPQTVTHPRIGLCSHAAILA